jgi:hypothetical protein
VPLQIRQGRHGPDALPLAGGVIRRSIMLRRAMTGSAGHLPGGRQASIEEYALTQPGHRRKRRRRWPHQPHRVRVQTRFQQPPRPRNILPLPLREAAGGRGPWSVTAALTRLPCPHRDEQRQSNNDPPQRGGAFSTLPVSGSKYSAATWCVVLKSNIPTTDPAVASNDPPPRRSPSSQLSSMNRTTEASEMRA